MSIDLKDQVFNEKETEKISKKSSSLNAIVAAVAAAAVIIVSFIVFAIKRNNQIQIQNHIDNQYDL